MGLKHTLDVANTYGYVKRIVDLKIQILSLFTLIHVPPNLCFSFFGRAQKKILQNAQEYLLL